MKKLSPLNYIVFTMVIIILGLLSVTLKLPYSINSYCKIQPARKWILTMGTDGQLLGNAFNYMEGVSNSIRASQFAREGTMRLVFDPLTTSGNHIEIGDTIATIYSSETEERIAELEGQLGIMQASFTSSIKGEKESVVKEYEAKVVQAEEAVTNQKLILNRLKGLYEKKLISEQEYEIAEAKEKSLVREVEIAKSQLETARTGSKPEEVKMIKAQIAAIEIQLKALNKRKESFSLLSPISGRVSRSYSSDTLLIIADVTSYVAIIPIKANEIPYTVLDGKVNIYHNGSKNIDGLIIHLDNEINTMNGEQIGYGTALINGYHGELPLGILSKCVISCEPVTIKEYIKRLLVS
ncbi:MAG: hypothetical protein GY855_13015 [candidate division Zixibacteria bacterium]|nr:hypothetical protein [candidate division Zixibacteria bacterium]